MSSHESMILQENRIQPPIFLDAKNLKKILITLNYKIQITTIHQLLFLYQTHNSTRFEAYRVNLNV